MNAPFAAPALQANRPRVAIIGAGPGGLAAAMLLAAQGARVTIHEKDAVIGGRTRTLTTEQGYRFDLGPTFFLYPRILSEIFSELRREPGGGGQADPARPAIPAGLRGLRRRSTRRRTSMPMEAALRRLAPGDDAGLRPFMEENRRKLAAFRPVLENAFASPTRFLSPGVLKSLPLMRPHRTVDEDLATLFQGPAGPARLLLPDQIPRHEPVPLPEPLHHPVLPRIRARHLPPASAAAARSRRRWRGWRSGWASISG